MMFINVFQAEGFQWNVRRLLGVFNRISEVLNEAFQEVVKEKSKGF